MEDTAGEALIMSQQITSHQRVSSLVGHSTSINLKFKHRYVFIPNKYNYERLVTFKQNGWRTKMSNHGCCPDPDCAKRTAAHGPGKSSL